MKDVIVASAPVSKEGGAEMQVELKVDNEVLAGIEAEVKRVFSELAKEYTAKIDTITAEIEGIKRDLANGATVSPATSPVKTAKTKKLFFKDPIHTDAGARQGWYEPSSDAEFNRLKPYSDEIGK